MTQTAVYKTSLHPTMSYANRNVNIKLLKKGNETFLLHQLEFDESASHAFDIGSFFTRQSSGLRMGDWKFDERLVKLISPIATFQGSAFYDDRAVDKKYEDKNEFIAIAEGVEIPLYIFTYNIEMTQFVYTNLMVKEGQEEIIDKSIPARHHA